ncbi:glycosyltransferase family 2 protein [Vibrio chagasii]|uniref:glycosyltransferase family 2 protein n=1 Tax=Vibrio chagasii TaxID=170679 RepID=UPI0038CDBFB0
MDVSIVIPYFNSHDTISKTLDSVIKKDPGDIEFEVNIIDDGSSQQSLTRLEKIVEQLSSDFVKVISLEKNKGVSNARNEGIRHSKGELIYFLDSDDILLSQFWEEAKYNKNLSNTICYNLRVNHKINKHKLMRGELVNDDILALLLKNRVLHLSNFIFHRGSIPNPFDKNYKYGEDLLFILSNIIDTKVTFVDNEVAIYKYDGKFHPATNSAFPKMLDLFNGRVELYNKLFISYNERKYIHNNLLSFDFDDINYDLVSWKVKAVSSLKSKRFYEVIQRLRALL